MYQLAKSIRKNQKDQKVLLDSINMFLRFLLWKNLQCVQVIIHRFVLVLPIYYLLWAYFLAQLVLQFRFLQLIHLRVRYLCFHNQKFANLFHHYILLQLNRFFQFLSFFYRSWPFFYLFRVHLVYILHKTCVQVSNDLIELLCLLKLIHTYKDRRLFLLQFFQFELHSLFLAVFPFLKYFASFPNRCHVLDGYDCKEKSQ
ncbi:transmembrane protein, putative (macronuclear) [Tetrahymena thermophila SB210]|uniref:Transmembrane protein, putative n=1 Tax=Tetrahymena thermophila (strain SB210) TaxID=312017 RepID=W7XGU7_TETTS|nr:transmembrane protein, putative [Tetrahymena thermophila SB210]EWS76283.1 transmembrane protein, putative [Tetrahymena thermophila SB210]|eukprot:XP_012651067.1 transmembrane protein, putative [Tetrahymena thermophila SB210]